MTNYFTVDGQIYGEETGGTFRGFIPDALDSVMATTTSGTSAENTYRYKPFGELLAKTGASADPKFMWVGELGYRDDATSMYMRMRHYFWQSGCWTTTDRLWPMEPSYRYANSSPVTRVDATGLRCDDPCGRCRELLDDELCDWAISNDFRLGIETVVGFVACCGDRKVVCTRRDVFERAYGDPGEDWGTIKTCIEKHEAMHRDDRTGICGPFDMSSDHPCGVLGAPGAYDKVLGECRAMQMAILCMRDTEPPVKCPADTPMCNWLFCECCNMKTYCKSAGREPGPAIKEYCEKLGYWECTEEQKKERCRSSRK